MGTYYMGMTAHFAQVNGYYKNNFSPEFAHTSDAKIMYAGALLYLVTLIFTLLYVALGILIISKKDSMGNTRAELVWYFMSNGTWLGSWLFWAGTWLAT